jgi:hypothetical protein
MQIFHVNTIPLQASANCFTTISNVTTSSSPYLIQEGFETAAVSPNMDWYLPSGTVLPYSNGVVTIPKVTTFNTNNIYTGSNGVKWVIMGYCVEIDKTGRNSATSPQGNYTAELDCDNGNGTAGNSSISTKQYLNVGEYELRYFSEGVSIIPTTIPSISAGPSPATCHGLAIQMSIMAP